MMSDDQILEVVQAHKEGKQIQLRRGNIPEWNDVVRNSPSWNFEVLEYRVAPEPRKPREWWVHVIDGEIRSCLSAEYHDIKPSVIRVREVLE